MSDKNEVKVVNAGDADMQYQLGYLHRAIEQHGDALISLRDYIKNHMEKEERGQKELNRKLFGLAVMMGAVLSTNDNVVDIFAVVFKAFTG